MIHCVLVAGADQTGKAIESNRQGKRIKQARQSNQTGEAIRINRQGNRIKQARQSNQTGKAIGLNRQGNNHVVLARVFPGACCKQLKPKRKEAVRPRENEQRGVKLEHKRLEGRSVGMGLEGLSGTDGSATLMRELCDT